MNLQILNSFLLAYIIYVFYSYSKNQPLRKYFFIGLAIKLLAGMAVAFIYKFYYKEGDVLYTFHQGELLRELLLQDPINFWKFPHTGVPLSDYYFGEFKDLNSRLMFFVKIIAVVNTLTFNNLWLTSLWFSFVSFLGFWYLANVLARLFPESKQGILFSFFLLPSVVFWSSGILKESLLCGAICGGVGVFLNGLAPPKPFGWKGLWVNSFLFIACLFVIWKIKYFYLAGLLPILFAYAIVDILSKKWEISFLKQLAIFFLILLITGFLASFIHPNLRLDYFLIALYDSHIDVIKSTDADNLIYFDDFQATVASLLQNLPIAIFGGLFEPLVWEIEGKNIFKLLAGLENLLIYAVFGLSMLKYLGKNSLCSFFKPRKYSLLVVACLTYTLLLAAMMTLSMPSIGTLVRYKAGFLPFWVYLLSFRLYLRFDFLPTLPLRNQK
jgi:hypothetical protein